MRVTVTSYDHGWQTHAVSHDNDTRCANFPPAPAFFCAVREGHHCDIDASPEGHDLDLAFVLLLTHPSDINVVCPSS
jgi:hypothetical protein